MKILVPLAAALMLTTAAGAASAQDARIKWGDLNMASASGADAFDARIDAAARKLCRDARTPGSLISDRAFCQAAVRAEAVRQLPGAVRVDYALSRLPIVA
ncbi:UrcA family protein [Brevundimonas sp.]|uniref:UrcA family protein n=1 Tax=Brevundimonas sp. TaxID=1871086 RepID=UPI003565122D